MVGVQVGIQGVVRHGLDMILPVLLLLDVHADPRRFDSKAIIAVVAILQRRYLYIL